MAVLKQIISLLIKYAYVAAAIGLTLLPASAWTIEIVDGPDQTYIGVFIPIASKSIVFSLRYDYYLGPLLAQFGALCVATFAVSRAPGWLSFRPQLLVFKIATAVIAAGSWLWAALSLLFFALLFSSGGSRLLLNYDENWQDHVLMVTVFGQRVF
jgi:hypothetical protein